jgi:hypothetical protein
MKAAQRARFITAGKLIHGRSQPRRGFANIADLIVRPVHDCKLGCLRLRESRKPESETAFCLARLSG